MKATQKRFIARILTICMGLVSFFLVDAAISGALSLTGALCLIPASLFVTNVLWQLSLRRVKRASKTTFNKVNTQPEQPAIAPTLYVVNGGTSPISTSEPPHVA